MRIAVMLLGAALWLLKQDINLQIRDLGHDVKTIRAGMPGLPPSKPPTKWRFN